MKLSTILSLLACLVAGHSWAGEDDLGTKPRFREEAVKRGSLKPLIKASGTLEPEDVVDIGAVVSGTIRRLGDDPRDNGKTIDFNTPVKKGTVLAEMDPTECVERVEAAKADVMRAKANLALAKAKSDLAKLEFERAKKKADNKEIDAADVHSAKARCTVAEADVEAEAAAVQQNEVKLKSAVSNLGYTTIRSPCDGIVIERRCNVGQTVVTSLNSPGLFLIALNLKKLQVWASVTESEISAIKDGQAASFTVPAFRKEKFEGRVASTRLNAALRDGVVLYTVIIETDNSDGKLLPYMTANVTLQGTERKDLLLVPSAALVWRPPLARMTPDDREAYVKCVREAAAIVWVQQKSSLRMVRLKTGLSDGTMTEVIDGQLNVGTKVVTGTGESLGEPN